MVILSIVQSDGCKKRRIEEKESMLSNKFYPIVLSFVHR